MFTNLTGSLPIGGTTPAPNIRYIVPESNPNGQILVISPGGGYWQLTANKDDDYAKSFSSKSIASFVVDYRLASQGYKHYIRRQLTSVS